MNFFFLGIRISTAAFAILAFAPIASYAAETENSTANEKAVPGNVTIATLGNQNITLADFNRFVAQLPERERSFVKARGPQILENLVRPLLIVRYAEAERLNAKEIVKKELADMRNEILIRAAIRSLQKEFRPSEEEIKAEYENNKDSYRTGDKVTASHIMVSSEKEANDLIAKLEEGGNFAELAKELSVEPEREKGGSLGTMARGQFRTTGLPEAIEQTAFSLDNGTYSKAVKSIYGWHVVYTKEKITGKQLAFSEARASIEEKLGSEKFGTGIRNLLAKLRETYPVKMYPENIR